MTKKWRQKKNLSYCIYLETSAVNYLVNTFETNELIAIKKLIKEDKNASFFVSSTTIAEILSTQDELRKERLIYCTQNICSQNLLNSPSEFIINYINAGMPNVESKYDFYSKHQLANTWRDLCNCVDKTFIYNPNELKTRIKGLQKEFSEITKDLFTENTHLQQSIEYAINKNEKFNNLNEYEITIKKISWVLIFLILCCGVDLIDNIAIEKYWNRLKLESTMDRLLFSIENLERLTEIGPIVMMARMWYSQSGSKHNRGTLLDMLHSIYLIYCDTFLTNDKHFLSFKDSDDHINFRKIQYIPENLFFKQLKNILSTAKNI